MEFKDLSDKVSKIKKLPLPGESGPLADGSGNAGSLS